MVKLGIGSQAGARLQPLGVAGTARFANNLTPRRTLVARACLCGFAFFAQRSAEAGIETTPASHRRALALAIVAASALRIGPAEADLGAIGSFTTNYFYRGYSKSDNRPTLRGNLDYEHDSGLYVGSWLSWVDFGDGEFPGHSDLEFYPYLGYSLPVTDEGRAEIAIARYIFNDQVFGAYSDYNEYSLAVHFRDSATARIDYADDAYHRGRAMLNYEISGRYPLTDTLELSAGVGYNDARAVLEYDSLYWHGGLTWYWTRLAFDFRYVDYKHLGSADPGVGYPLLLQDVDPKFVFSLSIGY